MKARVTVLGMSRYATIPSHLSTHNVEGGALVQYNGGVTSKSLPASSKLGGWRATPTNISEAALNGGRW